MVLWLHCQESRLHWHVLLLSIDSNCSSYKQDAGPTPGGSPVPEHQHQPFKTMSNAFRKGVQYNSKYCCLLLFLYVIDASAVKIVIRGDVMTGKSTLCKSEEERRVQLDNFY